MRYISRTDQVDGMIQNLTWSEYHRYNV